MPKALSDKKLQFVIALLAIWWLLRHIDVISDVVTQLVWLTFLVGGFVLCFVGGIRACYTGLTKEKAPESKGGGKGKGKK